MIVSFQGARVSQGQLKALEFQKRCKAAFLNPTLSQTVSATLALLEVRKELGVKPEKQWFLERDERGTCCVAEWMGY